MKRRPLLLGMMGLMAMPAMAIGEPYRSHIEALKKRLPNPSEFTFVVLPPYVIAGDEAPESVKRHAHYTVKWAADAFKRDFFSLDPVAPLTVWLFRDKNSYNSHVRHLYRRETFTPYGYFSSQDHALVMNIATGGGTLVHEMVHAFMEVNVPGCPSWLDEGLGSLFEQCGEEQGHIKGYLNWRLPIVQQAIREGETLPFDRLTALSAHEFYGKNLAVHYAQSRYLLYYLQEMGRLVRFFNRYKKQRSTDPTGFKTLQQTLQQTDMAAFQKEWERFTLKLR